MASSPSCQGRCVRSRGDFCSLRPKNSGTSRGRDTCHSDLHGFANCGRRGSGCGGFSILFQLSLLTKKAPASDINAPSYDLTVTPRPEDNDAAPLTITTEESDCPKKGIADMVCNVCHALCISDESCVYGLSIDGTFSDYGGYSKAVSRYCDISS